MRLAIVLRGIFYNDLREKETIPENNLKSLHTDYRVCLPLFRENLLYQLSKVFESIDIFIVTYENELLEQIKVDYDVRDSLIYERNKMFGTFTMEKLSDMMVDGFELFKKNNSENEYTHCLLTRPDLYFFKKFNLEKLDLEKINFGWTHDGGHNCDNFILTHSKYVNLLIDSLNNSKFSHGLQKFFETKDLNFISRPISSTGEKIQSDFYVIFRNIERYLNNEFIVE